MKLKVILLICIFLLPMVLADNNFVYKKNTEVDLKISCFDENNTLCNSNTKCMININKPDGDNLVQNGTMTFNLDYFNYTLGKSNLSAVGEYYVVIRCQGTTNGFSTFIFKVTGSGEEFTQSKSLFYIGVMAILVFFFIIILVLIGNLPRENPRNEEGKIMDINWLKHLFLPLIAIAWGILVMISFLAWNLAEAYFIEGLVASIFKMIFTFLMISITIGVPVIIVYTISYIVQDIAVKKYVERGIM